MENENKIMTIEGIRCYEKDGTAYLNLEAVARGLGFTQTQMKNGVAYTSIRWERVDQYLSELSPTCGGRPEYIPENIFCRLAMKAKNEAAEKFQAKVADEIIPSIRKHGTYMTPETIQEVLSNPDTIIQLALRLKEEASKRKALESTVAMQTKRIEEMTPKVSYCDSILRCEEAVTTTIIAKDYGMSAVAFNRKLNELGIQYRMGKVWVPYQKYADQGYTKTETYHYEDDSGKDHANVLMKWTQKGRLFLYEELKSAGILPSVERAA